MGIDSNVSCPPLCTPTILAKPGKTWQPKLDACRYVDVKRQLSEIQGRRNEEDKINAFRSFVNKNPSPFPKDSTQFYYKSFLTGDMPVITNWLGRVGKGMSYEDHFYIWYRGRKRSIIVHILHIIYSLPKAKLHLQIQFWVSYAPCVFLILGICFLE